MRVAPAVLMFALYAWLCQWFYILHVIDLCADASVGYDSAKRACAGLPFGEIWDVGARAGYLFWLTLLGLPALPVFALNRVVRYVLSRANKRPSNSPLQPSGHAGGVAGS
jgi:hypothetical protein